MRWITLTLFAIWLVVGVVWLSSSLIKMVQARRQSFPAFNAKQKRLSLAYFALFVLSLLVVPWRVDAQLLGFPILSQVRYGLIWCPPFGAINSGLVGILSPQGGILLSVMLVEWLVLLVSFCFFIRAFRDSTTSEDKHDA